MNWKYLLVIVIGFFGAWLVADYVTSGGFQTTEYVPLHVNHSFVGAAILIGAFVFRGKISMKMFPLVVGIAVGLMVHDAIRFGELCGVKI